MISLRDFLHQTVIYVFVIFSSIAHEICDFGGPLFQFSLKISNRKYLDEVKVEKKKLDYFGEKQRYTPVT
jgi:hypothetical protein